ncbi:MAG: nuclear transport factor 2 family protein [Methanoregulaceae archaeon]|nr:nuclear transport factor 2 family protein [Methanoregulaceae archaeon]
MALSEKQELEIVETFASYAEAYHKKDKKALSQLCSPEIIGFGSGPDEVFQGKKELMEGIARDFKQANSVQFRIPAMSLNGEGRVAWATCWSEFSVTIGDKQVRMLGRMTAVLKNTGRTWRFEQIHFSMPYEGQETGQSFPGVNPGN